MKKKTHLDRILGRVEDLDPENLQILIKRLAKERKLLETVFDSIKDGILVIDSGGVIEYANVSAYDLLQLKDTDVGRSTLWKHVPDLGFMAKDLRSTSLDLKVSYPEERYLRIYIAPLDAGGEDTQYTVIMTDATEDRLTTQEMIESEKLSSVFMLAAGVAHELGNPLNSINIHLQLIERQLGKMGDGVGVEKIRDSLGCAVSEVGRLDSIIENFLNAIRPRQPELLEVNLLELLDETLATLAQELEDGEMGVEVELGDSLPIVDGDPNQIKQVFYNLIKNGVEAMKVGGKLVISTESDDNYVMMRFRDNGTGITQEDLSHVFEPYYSTKQTGYGLGMMVVQRIMRDHGGQVLVQSEEGQGTVVTLQFPLKSRRIRMLEGD